MKSISAKYNIVLVLAGLLFAGLTVDQASANPNSVFARQVAGSYLADLQLTGTDGTPFRIQALATLAADGGAVATDTDDFGLGSASFFHSPKHGAWKRTGARSISITVLEFAFDSAGNLTTVFKLNFLTEFDSRQFEKGAGTVTFSAFLPAQDPLDPETTPIATGGGSFTFRRISP